MSERDPADIFREEAAELMEQLELALLDLERTPRNQALIDSAFRALHTIKGSGAMFGFERVATFIHGFETAFDRIRKGHTQATPELIRTALEANDHIRQLIHAPEAAKETRGDAILAALARATSMGQGEGPAASSSGFSPAQSDEAEPSSQPDSTWHLELAFDAGMLINGNNPLVMFDDLRALGDCQIEADWGNIPPLEDLEPQTLYLTWQATLTTAQPIEMLDEVFMFVLDEMRLEKRLAGVPVVEHAGPAVAKAAPVSQPAETCPADGGVLHPAQALPGTGPLVSGAAQAAKGNKDASTVRVPAERLDELMDRVGELVIVQARLSQLAASRDETIKSVAEDIVRLTAGLRESVMGIRMVPIGSLFVRFRRLLHDLSRELGKEIELTTVGDETELDKTMIERLADPLVHVIRNSADHGLESTATRLAAGKDATGRINLVARHAGAEVLVSVSDDGLGLDAKRIRQKAEEQGLLASGAAVPDAELYQMIFQPGFSTAKEVSALSGRGVGMDVVKKTIEAMRGSVDIATKLNEGTTVTFRLPLTLAIIEGLLVRVADTRFVIPLTAVEECVELSELDDRRSEGRSFLNIRGGLIPFLRLRELFGEEGEAGSFQKVVIVSSDESRVGLVVDQIIGSHQTVIKSLSKLHADVDRFSGATILGDGSVALILDILHVVALGQTLERRYMSSRLETV